MQFKNIMSSEVMDVDMEKKTVKAVWASFNNVDLDMDIIVPEAVTKTIRERGPGGKKLIWSLVDHRASLKYAIGKPSELYVEGDKLIAVTKISETELGEDIIKMYNDELINQHSIGFATIKADRTNDVRTIRELMLYEGSAVLWGANPETPTIGMKSLDVNEQLTATQRLEKLCKAMRIGQYTDETFSLMEIEIQQIKSMLEKSTPPAPVAVEPQNEQKALYEAIQQFNKQFKIN
jgi:HK97 family phage prohead protease